VVKGNQTNSEVSIIMSRKKYQYCTVARVAWKHIVWQLLIL